MIVKDAPRGRGPYGICATPQGDIWWCSLAGSFIARIDQKGPAIAGRRAADEKPGRAPRLERQPRPHLGQQGSAEGGDESEDQPL